MAAGFRRRIGPREERGVRNALFLPILLLFLLAGPAATADPAGRLLDAEAAWQHADSGNLVIVDVRSESEWMETGIPLGARTISLYRTRGVPDPDFVGKVLDAVGGDRDRPVAVICAAGFRSGLAARELGRDGFSQVHDIAEGMLGSRRGPGWLARGLPTEPCRDCAGPDDT